ncbi:TspO/MBR family protein [Clostridium sp. DJ247]|uniref:TspO/MBR family protein n=1 Tax=Clostridium sp. DJ247 TaxID=2726188 RepID=UPI0016249BE6|nr:TspO/MBR family protein [Clostridium sp. DJ247]MBC2582547.1 tryptophan-rich sensory protein [Clostridium sp. DJ247]
MINIFKVEGKKNIAVLLISIVLTEAAGVLWGLLSMPSINPFDMSNFNIYNNLIKPSFSPPAWIFPIVWSILYFIMAIAYYRIWLSGKQSKNIHKAKIYYFIQLTLNLIWTIIFFRYRLYGLAFIDLIILLVFILLTTFEFYNIDRIAGLLMILYIIWVSFAGVLSYYIWVFNEM